ncbi:MAG: EcsC family protein [Pseudomonadota bacterium]
MRSFDEDESFAELVGRALEEQKAFENRRATRLGRGAERLTVPAGGVLARLIPPGVVRMALRQADRMAGLTIPAALQSHDPDDLTACDAAALRVQAWAQGANAATGSAAGWFGAAGLAVDLPATIALAARNVRATGVVYGFTENDDGERLFRLMVLDAATALASEQRQNTLISLNNLARELSAPEMQYVLRNGGEWVIGKVVERVARQLGFNLARHKIGQIVPIIGAVVAAAVNASFQVDVARAARYAYRQRWLITRNALPAPEWTA